MGFGTGFKVEGGYDFVDNDADPMDTLGHGTSVAGVLAASPYTVGGKSYQGIAPNAKLLALRVDDGDETTSVSDATIDQALKWCVDHQAEYGIDVVNISYGQGDFTQKTVSSVYGDDLQKLHDLGVAVVASAGNSGDGSGAKADGGINLPAADPNVISVGSVESDDSISDFSFRGPALSVLAPGDDLTAPQAGTDGGGYGLRTGTSFAAPVVSGVVALMKQIDPTLTPADALSILRAGSKPNLDGDIETANTNRTKLIFPRIDVDNALSLATSRKAGTTQQQADVGKLGNQSAIVFDGQGVLHEVYYDVFDRTMKYATRNTNGDWSSAQTIDTFIPELGYYFSLALNQEGRPSVAYYDATNADLKYATLVGTEWRVQTLDSKAGTGLNPSLLFDRNDNPVIAYYRKSSGDLRVARADFNGNWTFTYVATAGDVGRGASLAMDSKGTLGIAYGDSTHGWLDYATLAPRTSTWVTQTIDNSINGVDYISNAYNPDTNVPYISYYAYRPGADLKVIHQNGRKWTSQTVYSKGVTGLFTTTTFADRGNGPEPLVFFWDKRTDSLDLASLDDDGDWTVDGLQKGGGRFTAAAISPVDERVFYTYYDTATKAEITTRLAD